ncbi:MAG TPA: hypothetical protein VFH51_06180, partial [Myxococcota bacterium]|nr:hypothetical protein [Myxococcota bacterium]
MLQHFVTRPEHPRAWEVRRFLACLPSVRVVLDTECGGFGHPASAITLVQRFRELGFTGACHVVFAGSNEQKLAALLPGFVPGKASQVLTDGTHCERLQPGMALPFVPLTIASPDVHSVEAGERYGARYNTRVFLSVQPTAWRGVEFVEIDGVLKRLSFPTGAALYATPSAASSSPEQALERTDPAVAAFFQRLLTRTANGEVAYGVSYGQGPWDQHGEGLSAHRQLAETVAGLEHAQSQLARPLLLLAFGDGHMAVAHRLRPTLERDATPAGRSVQYKPVTGTSFAQLSVGDICVVALPRQRKEIFELLRGKSRLPAISEGAGATHECIASGQPHLHGSRPPDCIWRAPFASAEAAAQREASSVLEGTHTGSQEQRARALGDFMARSA